jgi:hypothetical protein
MARVAAQDQWRRRGRASLVRRHGVAPCERGTGIRPPFEGSAVLFQGCGALTVREWVEQCRGADTGLITQCRIVAGMASPGGLVEQHRDMTPRHVEGTACARRCQSIKCPGRGSRYGGGRRARASSEADLTRGGVQPPSEAEPHTRGRLALERSGTLPEGASSPQARRTSPEGTSSPRARQSFVSGAVPLERSRVSPEGGWANCFGGPLGPPGP